MHTSADRVSSRAPRLRLRLRLAAVTVGAVLPLLGSGVARADLPPIPTPPTINLVPSTPTTGAIISPPPAAGCDWDLSFDNSTANPPTTVFRGQSACGAQVVSPVFSGQAVLIDVFTNVIATAPAFSQTGGVGTSESQLVLQPGTLVSAPTGSGPIPGLNYTIRYDASITLTAPQHWDAPMAGCTVNGQTQHCVLEITYTYFPATAGGVKPA